MFALLIHVSLIALIGIFLVVLSLVEFPRDDAESTTPAYPEDGSSFDSFDDPMAVAYWQRDLDDALVR